MKALIFSLMIFIAVPTTGFAQIEPIGYWILTHDKDGYKSTTTIELVDVYTIAETVLPGNCINFNQKLKESVLFLFDDGKKSFRVEVRKINHNGKFKALSRKEIKKYLKV